MNHRPEDCNGGHGCAGPDCCCPCHFDGHAGDDDDAKTFEEWPGGALPGGMPRFNSANTEHVVRRNAEHRSKTCEA